MFLREEGNKKQDEIKSNQIKSSQSRQKNSKETYIVYFNADKTQVWWRGENIYRREDKIVDSKITHGLTHIQLRLESYSDDILDDNYQWIIAN